ncbi:hypothetical protein [Streptomyces sp.]|uniref:hypothetical protein n=1 Tax=Streptomyces sp. TaxID=1931 RepID=UPI002F93193B
MSVAENEDHGDAAERATAEFSASERGESRVNAREMPTTAPSAAEDASAGYTAAKELAGMLQDQNKGKSIALGGSAAVPDTESDTVIDFSEWEEWEDTSGSYSSASAPDNGDRPLDFMAAFKGVENAWNEIVPAEQCTREELLADIEHDVSTLQELLVGAGTELSPSAEVASVPALTSGNASSQTGQERQKKDLLPVAGLVSTALRAADAHAASLHDVPEWRQIQTVRGAVGHLWRVLKNQAGVHFGRVIEDGRVADFFRRVSIRVCEKIAEWALDGADRLRGGDGQHEHAQSVEALTRLGYAASHHSSRGTRPTSYVLGPGELDVPAMRRMGEALNRPLPEATNRMGKRVSSAAAKGRSTTVVQGPKKPASGKEQEGSLRRFRLEQDQARRPQR